MKYIIAVPDNFFYLWQLLVQITNFRIMGIDEDVIILVIYFGENPSPTLTKIMNSPKIKAKFFLYRDERPMRYYSSSMRPWMIAKFLKEHDEVRRGTFMYLDPDVVFTRKPDFSELLNDHVWYISPANSYMDVNYIKSKGDDVFDLMTKIIGIDPQLVIKNDAHAGGVQYIYKNVPVAYWEKVYHDCEILFRNVTELNNKKIADSKAKIAALKMQTELHNGTMSEEQLKEFNLKNPVYHELQIWCADMWSCLWNAWLMGYEMKIHPSMDFIWAPWPISDWSRLTIFHDAGIPKEDGRNFCKVTHQYSPFKKEIFVNPQSASYKYLDIIKKTEILFPELIW